MCLKGINKKINFSLIIQHHLRTKSTSDTPAADHPNTYETTSRTFPYFKLLKSFKGVQSYKSSLHIHLLIVVLVFSAFHGF